MMERLRRHRARREEEERELLREVPCKIDVQLRLNGTSVEACLQLPSDVARDKMASLFEANATNRVLDDLLAIEERDREALTRAVHAVFLNLDTYVGACTYYSPSRIVIIS